MDKEEFEQFKKVCDEKDTLKVIRRSIKEYVNKHLKNYELLTDNYKP